MIKQQKGSEEQPNWMDFFLSRLTCSAQLGSERVKLKILFIEY